MNVPAGMWGKSQFTEEEVAWNRGISSSRIHVERAIGYLKNFKLISDGKISMKLVPHLSDIVFVCAQLYNINQVPLREVDRKFAQLKTFNK